MDRAVVFASYSKEGIIGDDVLYYLRALKASAEVIVFVADNELSPGEEQKLEDLVTYYKCRKHGSYDFGSYRIGYCLLEENGTLEKVDELLFANDSCYGPIFPFTEAFSSMEGNKCDFWGLTESEEGQYHLQSFFLVFRKKVFTSSVFRDFITNVTQLQSPDDYVRQYELQFTKRLNDAGFTSSSYIGSTKFFHQTNPTKWPQTLYGKRMPLIKKKALNEFFDGHLQEPILPVVEWIKKDNPQLYDILGTDVAAYHQHKKREDVPEWVELAIRFGGMQNALNSFINVEKEKWNTLHSIGSRKKISVALCTYNGEKYIERQLRSILFQQMPVDEIVVCDDASTDKTVAIIEKIKEEAKADIQVFVSHSSLGICGNFDKAIKLCKGDYIFLSDQDDWWFPDKIKTVVEWFENHPEKDVVFTNGYLMDDNEQPFTERTMLDVVGFTAKAQKFFDEGFQIESLLRDNRATGATMALRKSFVPTFQIDPSATVQNGYPLHDYVIALAAASLDKLGYIVKPLIRYRIHGTQSAGYGEWITNPPQTEDLLSPIVITDHFKLYMLPHILPNTRQRACFGSFRHHNRSFIRKWRLIFHYQKYVDYYGKRGFSLFLCDMFSK